MPLEHREYWGAVLFLAAIFAGAILLFSGLVDKGPARKGLRPPERGAYIQHLRRDQGRSNPNRRGEGHQVEPEPLMDSVQMLIAGAEPAANQLLDRDHLFIQLYGGVQRLSQRQVLDDADPRYSVVKLTDGSLTFINDQPLDTTGHGRSLVRLRDQLAQREVPLLYVQAPQKLQENDPRLPFGVRDFGNSYADQVLAVLEEQGVDSLDLRRDFSAMGRDWGSWFFDTDHHWTAEAGFTAAQRILAVMQSNFGYPTPTGVTNPDNFAKTTYENWFLGSQGKRTGTLYGGVDDIALWKPNFYTDFTYSIPIYEILREGPFETALLFPERLEERDFYNGNPYTLYAGGDYPLARIYNNGNENGPRVMLLRDSYSCAATPFLALGCGELITVDLRYFNDRLLTYVDWLKPDIVIVMYTAGSVGLDPLFSFFKNPAAPPFYEDRYQTEPIAAKPLPGASAEVEK